jgi:hypothetical protein
MMSYHGGLGIDLLPRVLWLSSSVTVWKTLAGLICLPPMARSEVLISTDQMRGSAGEKLKLTSLIGALEREYMLLSP